MNEASAEAYEKIKSELSYLQCQVLAACRRLGSFTDFELVALFPGRAYSTIRTRRGELVEKGLIRKTDKRRDRATVWECVDQVEQQGTLFDCGQSADRWMEH